MTVEIKKIGPSGSFIERGQFVDPAERASQDDHLQEVSHDRDFDETLKTADKIMDEYKVTLAALAR
jgi:hypothetical protein